MSAVSVKNVSKTYDGKRNAVDNLSLEITGGEFAVLLGHSGSGKSTLLYLMAGLEKPDSGQILIDGTPPGPNHNIGMVFQTCSLLPCSAFRNIALSLKLLKPKAGGVKLTKQEMRKKVERAAELARIPHLLERNCAGLSGGERQRVALARAIVRNPSLFLLDEPLTGLDTDLKAALRDEIKELKKSLRATFVYVTHDRSEAEAIADRVFVLENGKLKN